MRVTEYVGPDGVVSSEWDHRRAEHPKPGDPVRFFDGTYGMVWEVGDGHCRPGEAHICERVCSAFLMLADDKKTPLVSIGGGPFRIVPLVDLHTTYDLRYTSFWNWGDRRAGGDQGVDYQLARPVFNLTKESR